MSSIRDANLLSDLIAFPNVSDLADVQPKQHRMDCYIATLAGILHKTVPDLEKQTKINAMRGMSLSNIDLLYKKAGYTGEFGYFEKRDDFKHCVLSLFRDKLDELNENDKNKLKMKLAAGFMLKNEAIGHIVAVKVWYANEQCRYYIVDFQIDRDNRFTELPQDSEVLFYVIRDPIFYY